MNKTYPSRAFSVGPEAGERFSDQAYSILRDRLVTLHYEPLQPLNERELTVELGLGVAPIREALRRLEADRLVTIYPRRGIFASEIGLRDQQYIKEVRVEIEGLAAALAAIRATRKERDDLMAAADALIEEKAPADSITGDADIHQKIYEMARNPFLRSTLILHFNLALRLWYYCFKNIPAPDPRPVDHRSLAAAILNGDPDAARSLMGAHVQQDSDRIRDILFNKIDDL